MVRCTVSFFLILFVLKASAQKADTVLKHSPIKTLTDEQYTAMINSDDVNHTASVATYNYFPLPDHVLKYRTELKLTVTQLKQFAEVMRILNMKKKEVGISMILNEKMLDSLFRRRYINEGTVLFYGTRYGSYQGELRVALLMACLNTRKILTPMQMNKFYALEKPN